MDDCVDLHPQPGKQITRNDEKEKVPYILHPPFLLLAVLLYSAHNLIICFIRLVSIDSLKFENILLTLWRRRISCDDVL